jgi:hypothetical protein
MVRLMISLNVCVCCTVHVSGGTVTGVGTRTNSLYCPSACLQTDALYALACEEWVATTSLSTLPSWVSAWYMIP